MNVAVEFKTHPKPKPTEGVGLAKAGRQGQFSAACKAHAVHMKAFTVKAFLLLYAFEMVEKKIL